MTTPKLQLLYFFDPFCGWCYAAAPALAGLAETWPKSLKMMPSGLFSGPNARPMTQGLADYAWQNDQRIEQLTGQSFTTTYRDQLLRGEGLHFDSGPATRAMTALAAIDLALEPAFLHAAQIARYIEGQDTTQPAILAAIANHSRVESAAFAGLNALSEMLCGPPKSGRGTRSKNWAALGSYAAEELSAAPPVIACMRLHVSSARI